MTDRPSKPFKLHSRPNDEPLRDKDNAHPRHEPKIERKPAPNLAPGGAVGIRRGLAPPQGNKATQKKRFTLGVKGTLSPEFQQRARFDLNIAGNRINHGQWTKGTIKSMPGYRFEAKVFQAPSQFGIDNGVISKLHIRNRDGKVVVNYDRGWDKRPQTIQDRQAMQKVREGLGDFPERRFNTQEQDKSNDKSQGRGR